MPLIGNAQRHALPRWPAAWRQNLLVFGEAISWALQLPFAPFNISGTLT
jgi:hypothetical protein